MKWIGQHIWDFISRFRNDVYLETLTENFNEFTVVIGSDNKLYKSTYPTEKSRIQVRNDEGSTIPAGAPLYSRGEIGGSERILVGICLSSDPTKMPCIGVAEFEMNTTDTKDSFAITQGIYNTNISGFTGLTVGDNLYVNGGSAPHLTQTKPTNGDLIQNVGIVLKTNGTICQGLLVSAIGRTNDVPWPLYVDHTNQRVGIGTASPASPLHVYENTSNYGNNAGLTIENDGAGDAVAQFLRSGIKRWVIGIDSSDSNKFKIADSTDLSTDGLFTIDGDGNVGIGTTSPVHKLDLKTNPAIGFYHSNGTYQGLIGDGASAVSGGGTYDIGFRANASGNLLFAAGGSTERMRIDTSGNVGIGTTSPTEKLEVNGNIKASGTLIAKQYQAFQCNFINDISTTKYYLPLDTVTAQTVVYQDEACMLAHADGRLASVTLKVENLNGASGNITFGIEVLQSTGTGYSGTWTVVETETMAVASTHNHDVFHFHFSTAKHFDSTHMFAISIQSDNAALGGDGGNDERWFVTPVIEWDYNTYLGTNGTSTRYDTTP